ncbi:MAG: ATP-binding cassette domain-containing protein [Myxococcales bacterium]|nr:ATP-binding cassette domain-containing protein [Myxococcales bacterium]
MLPGFGKQAITIGSAPSCDIVLPGAAPEHARIVHQGGGKLVFVASGAGQSFADRRPLAAGEQVAFDFRALFHVGQTQVPFDHPAITLMLMAHGAHHAPAGQLVVGRDATRASLVIGHPSVSSLHATLNADALTLTDHGSTSGSYVGGQRMPPNTPTPVAAQGVVFFGPVPVQVSLLLQLAGRGQPQAAAAWAPTPSMGPAPQPQPSAQMAAQPAAQPQGVGTMAVPAAQALAVAQASAAAGGGAGGPSTPGGQAQLKKHKTVFGQLDFNATAGGAAVKTIGRTPNNDIVVPHAQVSSRHAVVHQIGGQLYVEDRGSANGTYVQGHRIAPGQKVAIRTGEKIYVGPMPLQLNISATGAVEVAYEAYSEERWGGRPLYEIEAWSLVVQVPDRDRKGETKTLLDNISFKALPGDMIALMGPSGAGKTTLLMTLNGYMPPTSGMVRINGEDLYNIYDTLRGSIGYVPQDDLVHPELTVFEAVRYSAKFRLPPDYSSEEIDQRVMQTIKDLGLEGVANLQIGAPEKKTLSGGQRKRVNIALELVTDPVILYLDEPTSGLASDDAASLIHLLHDLAKATGKTIIMTIHQPAKDEFEKFNMALILGYGGVPMFFGPTSPDAYRFFGNFALRSRPGAVIDNPRDMFAVITEREKPIFEQLKAQNPNAERHEARYQAALQWRQEYYQDSNPIYRRMYSGRRAVGTGDGARAIPERRPSTKGQFRLLLSRYFKTKVRDVGGTVIMFAQAPIIGILLAAVFGGQQAAAPAWCLGALQEVRDKYKDQMKGGGEIILQQTQDHTGALFFLVVAAIWFGTSNAAREIVRERSIYLRERMVTLGLFNYVMSKFVLLALFCVVQCTLLLSIVFFALKFSGGMQAFALELAALTATAIVAVAIGLLLSTIVQSSEAAMALTPIALIPQVVLGGLMVPATTIPKLAFLMYGIPARWGFEAVVMHERLAISSDPAWLIDLSQQLSGKLPPEDFFEEGGKFRCAVAQMASDSLNGAWGFNTFEQRYLPYVVMGGMTLALFILMCLILKRRDPV